MGLRQDLRPVDLKGRLLSHRQDLDRGEVNLDTTLCPGLIHDGSGHLDNKLLADLRQVGFGAGLGNSLDQAAPVAQDEKLHILVNAKVMNPPGQSYLVSLVGGGLR